VVDEGQLVLVAGAVTAGVVGSFVTSFYHQKRLRLEFAHSFNRAIFERRLAVYAEAWRITGALSSQKISPFGTKANLRIIADTAKDLHEWYNTDGGLILSERARDRYFAFRQLCKDAASLGDTTPDADRKAAVEKVWRMKVEFRKALRGDMQLDTDVTIHGPEGEYVRSVQASEA
jgi:hypothetical protein